MTPVIAFGEALVDMLSSRLGEPTEAQETFTPYAGGAPANVAVACARLGVPSQFLGMVGDDTFGHFIVRELNSHGVDTRGVVYTQDSRTALAFVSRDAVGERTFDFYRPPAADLLYRLFCTCVATASPTRKLPTSPWPWPPWPSVQAAWSALMPTCVITCGQAVRRMPAW